MRSMLRVIATSRLWGPEFIAELVAPFEFIRKI